MINFLSDVNNKVLFLNKVPVPHGKDTVRWDIGTVTQMCDKYVVIVDICGKQHTKYHYEVKKYGYE